MQQSQQTLTALQRLLREASLQLVDGMFTSDVSAASYGFLQQCQQSLMEAQNVLMQLRSELREQPSTTSRPIGMYDPSDKARRPDVLAHTSRRLDSDDSISEEGTKVTEPTSTIPKRGRGRAKGRYLRDEAYEPMFREHIVSIFHEYYIEDGDAFSTTDGTGTISASIFLACLYSVGVERGITAPSPSVKPMTDIIDELIKPTSSPHHIPSYITSYKTIIAKVNDWRTLVTREKRNLPHLYLHDITTRDLADGQLSDYEDWTHALQEVERIYDLTLPVAQERNT